MCGNVRKHDLLGHIEVNPDQHLGLGRHVISGCSVYPWHQKRFLSVLAWPTRLSLTSTSFSVILPIASLNRTKLLDMLDPNFYKLDSVPTVRFGVKALDVLSFQSSKLPTISTQARGPEAFRPPPKPRWCWLEPKDPKDPEGTAELKMLKHGISASGKQNDI